ncbi:hypothetical protein, partial [Streptomyces mexicanus]|uniref:hypothetical protein n=1 Tax=Streptomyces mexicanus TaxID=178566 RepID=UPI003649E02B
TALYLTFGGAWLAVSVWRLLAWPLILAGSLAVAVVAQVGEWAITRHLDRPKRSARRRAHARPQPTKMRKAA